MRHTKTKTRRDAVVFALKDFNKRQRFSGLAKMLGTSKYFMTKADLKTMRGGLRKKGF